MAKSGKGLKAFKRSARAIRSWLNGDHIRKRRSTSRVLQRESTVWETVITKIKEICSAYMEVPPFISTFQVRLLPVCVSNVLI